MPSSAEPVVSDAAPWFSAQDIAFARAWGVYAPGLGGWTVDCDSDDDRVDSLLIDPPLVYGEGFVVRPDSCGISISSALGDYRAQSLRDALLLICPLAPDDLKAAELLAKTPDPLI